MGRNFSELFAAKLARYHAAKKAKASRMAHIRRKKRAKARLEKVLAMARAALGWKPHAALGKKLPPSHVAALHAGRDLYHQAKREKKGSVKKGG
jgi:hypothetical protein